MEKEEEREMIFMEMRKVSLLFFQMIHLILEFLTDPLHHNKMKHQKPKQKAKPSVEVLLKR